MDRFSDARRSVDSQQTSPKNMGQER
ncbi:hypothetical protein ZOSMA_171G00530 [Zostera marina]|uniref:Uncharacterized protein n=1 Tax=Zostera marina TaxID=29655 RepID=A0A0K9PSB8_ZOSMR|nr:hypothetical protein ZOSMA_171G00530 [Zostera marina]